MPDLGAATRKIVALEALAAEIERSRAGRRIALTNGCFDLLHVGHTRALEFAARQGDVLVVGVNDDASVRSYKAPERPFTPASERAEMIAALECVDFVVLFGETTATRLVEALHPDVYVKGGDYDIGSLPEAPAVQAYGGEVILAPLVPGRSTTDLVERLQAAARRS